MPKLTPNFSLEELTRSTKAVALGIDNTPSPLIVGRLTRLAHVLESVRSLLGDKPITISSGYRAPALNAAVGGARSSAHLTGLAADFTCAGYGSPLAICKAIQASAIPFDQLIHEHGSWVHLGLAADDAAPRRQVLTIDRNGTRTGL